MIRNSTEQTSAICSFVTLRNVAPLLDSSQVRASCALATGGEIAQCSKNLVRRGELHELPKEGFEVW
jgi:hypothetical protein